MSRGIRGRHDYQISLVALTPIRCADGRGDGLTDMALARNGKGEFYIKGDGVAGAIRGHLEARAKGDTNRTAKLNDYFGTLEGASFVCIDDALITLPGKLKPEVRDGVGIDRFTGAAAGKIKYDSAVLPRGSRLDMQISFKPTCDAHEEALVAITNDILAAFCSGRIRLGGGKTRGFGRVKLDVAETKLKRRVLSLKSPEETVAALESLIGGTNKAAWTPVTEAEYKRASADPGWESYVIEWKPEGPLQVRADMATVLVDGVPLVSAGSAAENGEPLLHLVLPGSGIKGAFRSRAEYIIRTILGDAALPTNGKIFLDQLRVPLVTWLFGADRGASDEPEVDGLMLGSGALHIDDVYSKEGVTFADWQKMLNAKDQAELHEAIGRPGGRAPRAGAGKLIHDAIMHVAIDRWTAGASEGLLYSELHTGNVEWNPIQIDLDLLRIPETLRAPAATLLELVLRDFQEGWIRLGHGKTRGSGKVKVKAMSPAELSHLKEEQFKAWKTFAIEMLPRMTKAA